MITPRFAFSIVGMLIAVFVLRSWWKDALLLLGLILLASILGLLVGYIVNALILNSWADATKVVFK